MIYVNESDRKNRKTFDTAYQVKSTMVEGSRVNDICGVDHMV